jgi:hypothetical protein
LNCNRAHDKRVRASHDVEKLDRMARRTYGLSDGQQSGGTFSLNILTGQAAVQVISKSEDIDAP